MGKPTDFGSGFVSSFVAPPSTKKLTEKEMLQNELAEANAIVTQQKNALTELSESATQVAFVILVQGKRSIILNGTSYANCFNPPHLELEEGDVVAMQAKTMQIINVLDIDLKSIGHVHTVVRVLDDGRHCEITTSGPSKIVRFAKSKKVVVNDRVVVDPNAVVVLKNLGPLPPAHVHGTNTGITWDSIGGQEHAKKLLKEAIEDPYIHKELYKHFEQRPAHGALLFGPPGCGKTIFAKATASAIAEIHGRQATGAGFIYVKGPELLNKWVGESEAGIRKLFGDARKHAEEHGYPATIFIDECDALLGARGGSKAMEGMERTIVPQFLTEMDGLEAQAAFVLLATNRPDMLDAAIIRDGRIDAKIEIRRPTQSEARTIAGLYLKGKPGGPELVDFMIDKLFDKNKGVFMLRGNGVTDRRISFGEVMSGARIEAAVHRTVQIALRRLKDGRGLKQLTQEDCLEAIAEKYAEACSESHELTALEFLDAKYIRAIEKIAPAAPAMPTNEAAKLPNILGGLGASKSDPDPKSGTGTIELIVGAK